MKLTLTIELLTDTTFGRGDGVAGLLDEEVEHDSRTGLPIIRGRTVKGLLVEECANLLYVLPERADLETAAKWLFGSGGSTLGDGAHMRVGSCELPFDLRQQVQASDYKLGDILGSLTTIRRQTAMNEETGTPADRSLRGSRVVIRGLTFSAALDFDYDPNPVHLALLAACAALVRRAGSGRNRGRGHIKMRIEGSKFDFAQQINEFERLVKGRV